MRAMILLALMSVFSFGGQTQKLGALPKQLQGTIPEFRVLAIDNETELGKSNLKANAKKAGAKRIALSFFATWCVNCREEFALLKRQAKELEKNGVQLYLINAGENIHKLGDKASEMAKKYAGESFPLYFDPNGNLLKKCGFVEEGGNFRLPLTIVLDYDLKVLGVLTEVGEEDFPQILWSEF